MKKFLLFSLAVLLFSCDKDDCTKEQFVGTWEGTFTCTFYGSGEVVVDITSGSGSKLIISEEAGTNNPQFFYSDELKHDGCSAELKETILGTGATHNASLSSDGKILTLEYTVSALGVSSEDCTYVLELKQ